MSIIASNKKPSARTATGWVRGFENLPELTKREQQEMLADAARNTAAMMPQGGVYLAKAKSGASKPKRPRAVKARPAAADDELPA